MKIVKWFGFGLLVSAGLVLVPKNSTAGRGPCRDACSRYAWSVYNSCCDAHPGDCEICKGCTRQELRPVGPCYREGSVAWRTCMSNCDSGVKR